MGLDLALGSHENLEKSFSYKGGLFDPDRRLDVSVEQSDGQKVFDPDKRIEIDDRVQDVKDKVDLSGLISDYLDDLRSKSECPDTIPANPFKASDVRVRTPEEIIPARNEFYAEKNNLIRQWELINDREWPLYTHDVYSADGKTIIRKAGDRYDAHHIQSLKLGGNNDVSNITPLSVPEHRSVHSGDSSYSKLVKTAKDN